MIERRSDVQPPPGRTAGQAPRVGHRLEGSAHGQCRRGQHCRHVAEDLPGQQGSHREWGYPQDGNGGAPALLLVVQPHHIGAVRDRRAERVQHPGGGVGDLGQRGDGLGAGCGGLRISGGGIDGGARGGGGITQGRQVGRELVLEVKDAAGPCVVDRRGKSGDRGFQSLGQFGSDQPRGAAHGNTQRAGGELPGSHRGDPVGELVGFIDHQVVVFGQHRRLRDGVDGQQSVVGHHDVGVGGLGPRLLGETVDGIRAAGGSEAFPRRDADLRPGPFRYAGPHFVAVTGLGVRRPLCQARDVAAQSRRARRREQFVLGGFVLAGPAVDLVEAQIVAPTLQQREGGPAGQGVGQRVDQAGQIAIDKLPLECDRRGGHHHRGVTGDGPGYRGHQVGQGLAGAGSGLDRKVLTGAERLCHRLGHPQLAGPFGAAQRRHRARQQVSDRG